MHQIAEEGGNAGDGRGARSKNWGKRGRGT